MEILIYKKEGKYRRLLFSQNSSGRLQGLQNM